MLSNEGLLVVLWRQINFDSDQTAATIDCLATSAVCHVTRRTSSKNLWALLSACFYISRSVFFYVHLTPSVLPKLSKYISHIFGETGILKFPSDI